MGALRACGHQLGTLGVRGRLADLGRWTVVVMPVPEGAAGSGVLALGHGVLGYVATGFAARQPITWLSDDGMRWRIADVGPSADLIIDAIAVGRAGLLGFGVDFRYLDENEDKSETTMIVSKLSEIP
jgi:hypothetical protein